MLSEDASVLEERVHAQQLFMTAFPAGSAAMAQGRSAVPTGGKNP